MNFISRCLSRIKGAPSIPDRLLPETGVIENYDHLLSLPRYTETLVKLEGRDFLIPDAKSFYYARLEIFQEQIYQFSSNGDRPVILDCGANTGISALYFKKLFPKAELTAVEADPRIFRYLKRNMASAGLEDVQLIQKAVSASKGFLPFLSEGADAGRLVELDEEVSSERVLVECMSLDDLIQKPVDFLKIDIEGAEVDAILACRKLDMVKNLFVEYHSFKGEPQRLDALLKKISDAGFRYYIKCAFAPKHPFLNQEDQLGMDLQLNISCSRIDLLS